MDRGATKLTGFQQLTLALTCAVGLAAPSICAAPPSHGFSHFGELKYPADMTHFDYANPNAPKGGQLRLSEIGSFNNLNPFVDKGLLARDISPIQRLGSWIYDPLMRVSEDELASYYCYLAESVEVADDYSWVTYKLREDAYWHDGEPVTMEDVVWTWDVIQNASISWRMYFRDVERLEQIDEWTFKFHFSETAEKIPPLVVQTGKFAPLPKHYWEDKDIYATTMTPPLGNGPYRIASAEPSKLVLDRIEDYWAKDLSVVKGQFNFDRIFFIYFFDRSVMLQAMRGGLIDFYLEQNVHNFATAYDFDGYRKGLFKKETYTMGYSYGMHLGVVLNTRRPPLDDIRVREALTLAYNFEWANRVLWHGGMDRSNTYFMRTGMQAKGLPSKAELELLEPFRGQIPERVFTESVDLPKNEPFGRNRATLQSADALLQQAGWVVKDFERVHEVTGEPFKFELLFNYGAHERMLVPFVDNLKRLGIHAVLRKVEPNLLVNRMRNYDFDGTIRKYYTWKVPFPASMRSKFTSQYADSPNMTNYAGMRDPVIDFLVEKIAAAETEDAMNTAGRALDRVLLYSFYLIPDGSPLGRHLVYWDRLGHPPLGVPHMNWTGVPYLWWFDEEKAARVNAGIAELDSN